jgi:hypothetical protein
MTYFFEPEPERPDPTPPVRLREILAGLDLPIRRTLRHVEVARSREGDLDLLCLCDCGTMTDVTLLGPLDRLPGEVAFTCSCWTTFWIPASTWVGVR